MTKTWLITGAGRGMGVEFARAATAAGHNVVATGRNPDTVCSAVGGHENLLVTALDVNDPHSERHDRTTVHAALEHDACQFVRSVALRRSVPDA